VNHREEPEEISEDAASFFSIRRPARNPVKADDRHIARVLFDSALPSSDVRQTLSISRPVSRGLPSSGNSVRVGVGRALRLRVFVGEETRCRQREISRRRDFFSPER